MGGLPHLSELTTLRIGGVPQEYVKVSSGPELATAVQEFDGSMTNDQLLVLGGGSNLVVSDDPFPGKVIHVVADAEKWSDSVRVVGWEGEQVTLDVEAGANWDDLVAYSVDQGWSGLEALSGVPGTVGAAPVQNIGAYGREVGQNLVSVQVLDRRDNEISTLTNADLQLGYRDSLLKRSLRDQQDEAGMIWGPTGRWVVLSVRLVLLRNDMSSIIAYSELADRLGVEVGSGAPIREVREAVLDLRRSKGMVLDSRDHDTWSAGSFFMNPVLTDAQAAQFLPFAAPRYPTGGEAGVKTSAAWLIEQAGFHKGFGVREDARARLSTKHVLAVTNRGGATSKDVAELVWTVRFGVENYFGIRLVAEPILVGMEI